MGEHLILYSAYIGNLPPGTTGANLGEIFGAYDVKTIFVHPPDLSSHYTYGFVRFLSKEQRDHAVRVMDGRIFGSKKLRVEVSSKSEQLFSIRDAGRHEEELPCSTAWSSARCGSELQQQQRRLKMVMDTFSEQLDRLQQQHPMMASLPSEQPHMTGADASTAASRGLNTEGEFLELLQRTPYGLFDFDDLPPKPSVSRVDVDFVLRQLERMQESEQERRRRPAAPPSEQLRSAEPLGTLTVDAVQDPLPTAGTLSAYRPRSSDRGLQPWQQMAESGGATAVAGGDDDRHRAPETCRATWKHPPGDHSLAPSVALGRGRLLTKDKESAISASCGRGSLPRSLN